MKESLFSSLLAIICLMIPVHAYCDTFVTENITQNTIWDISGSPYQINSIIQVYENVTLTIQPGVEVEFGETARLEIGGQLIARGTQGSIINFNSSSPVTKDTNRGIVFLETAPSAAFKGGDRPTFIYDYANGQLLLEHDDSYGYESGSVMDYCLFDNFDFAIKAQNSLPLVMNSTIKNSTAGLHVDYNPQIPRFMWLFFYNNTVENCRAAVVIGKFYKFLSYFRRGIALISGNTFRNCSQDYVPVVALSDGDRSLVLLFNNQIINNVGIGIGNTNTTYDYYGHGKGVGPLVFLENNSITFNNAGVSLNGWSALLQNYITNNHSDIEKTYGAGAFLTGPVGMVFNNSIQLNGVNGVSDSHGDGIVLNSSEDNTFVLNHNNLGNSVWDMQDIYVLPDTGHCSTAKLMNVDAEWNSWMTASPSDHIYDQNDNSCSGTVDYSPVRSSAMIPAPIQSHPLLNSPQDNAYSPGVTSVTFSWEPVAGATKYLLCIMGKDTHYSSYSLNKMELVQSTSVDIDFSPNMGFHYGMKVLHWFVVAGNDNGWSLPSEVRKVTFSPDAFLVTGRVLDENGNPVAGAYVGYPDNTRVVCFSDENGNYSLIPELTNQQQIRSSTYLVQKQGYVPSYSYPRGQREFDIARDLVIFSIAKRDAIYNALGITRDTTKGDIAGVVVDDNDQALIGAVVSIDPPSGNIYYPDSNGNPDSSLKKTSSSGEFIILNVTPGNYQLSATLEGYSFSPTISVEQGAITADALIAQSPSSGGGGGGTSGGGGGGGGGG